MNITTLTFILAILAILTYGISFVKGIFRIGKKIDEPNQKQDLEIALIKKDIKEINNNLHEMNINHIDHIERDIRELIKGQVRIETLLKK